MNNEIIKLAKQLVEKLSENNLTISTAESCTGGLISAAITEISGSSSVFDRSFITYSNEAKIQMLRVCKGVLEDFGAVSHQVATQMAIGSVKHSNADISISVTGIAGPNGGSEKKPVGLVYIGIFKDGWSSAKVTKNNFEGNRTEVREQTTKKALELALEGLQE